jgi:hypothetical protein
MLVIVVRRMFRPSTATPMCTGQPADIARLEPKTIGGCPESRAAQLQYAACAQIHHRIAITV